MAGNWGRHTVFPQYRERFALDPLGHARRYDIGQMVLFQKAQPWSSRWQAKTVRTEHGVKKPYQESWSAAFIRGI